MATVKSVSGPDSKGHYKAYFDDGGSITFGPVTEPKAWKMNQKQQDLYNKKCWWISLEGNPHTTYIVDKRPVEGTSLNLVEIRYGNSKDASVWRAAAIAVLGSADLDL